MADISKITLPSGSTYDIKDAYARQQIEALSGYTYYIGVTTTPLTDGSTTNPITVNGESITANTGAICTYGNKEFIWNGTAWQEFGDLSALGDLAYADTASTSYTPQGSVSASFTGSSSSVTITASASSSGNYTPAGNITGTTFTGASMTSTGKFTPSGDISFTNTNQTATVSKASSGTATYTPEGSITGTTFTGSSMTSTGKFTPSGSVSFTNSNQTATVSSTTGTATYTPAGNITAGAITVKTAGSTDTIHNPTKVTVAKTLEAAAPGATAPSNAITYYAVANETLSLYQIGYTTGDSITTSDVTVKTGDAAYESANPTFSGTGVRLVTGNISVPSSATFSGTEDDVSVSGTTTGSVSNGTFSGTGVRLVTGNISIPSSATFSGDEGDVSVSGTTTGSVSNGTFNGTKVQLSGSTTASGSIEASFTGTAATITVNPD
jgi:hypothetical protein